MIRPTVEGLGTATDQLEELAWNCSDRNPNGFHQIAGLLDILVFLDSEAAIHARQYVYGQGGERSPEGGGTIGSHTIGRHGLGRPTESRLDFGSEEGRGQRGGQHQPPIEPADQAYRDIRQLQRDIGSTLTSVLAQFHHRAEKVSGYPRRTEATG